MDKKILIISAVVLVLLLAVGFSVYKYMAAVAPAGVENMNDGASTQVPENEESQPPTMDGTTVEVVGESQGGLTICSDKCGDGICQAPEPACNNVNCTCKEDKQECPQDCK